jgi:hypothetical protein
MRLSAHHLHLSSVRPTSLGRTRTRRQVPHLALTTPFLLQVTRHIHLKRPFTNNHLSTLSPAVVSILKGTPRVVCTTRMGFTFIRMGLLSTLMATSSTSTESMSLADSTTTRTGTTNQCPDTPNHITTNPLDHLTTKTVSTNHHTTGKEESSTANRMSTSRGGRLESTSKKIKQYLQQQVKEQVKKQL